MHFEILVEDLSGKKLLEGVLPKIIPDAPKPNIIVFPRIKPISKGQKDSKGTKESHLLQVLSMLFKAYGKAYPKDQAAVIVVCDLDRRRLKEFRQQLLDVLSRCDPQPETRFCIAVEEGEAWLLGDLHAIRKAYPKAKGKVLSSYEIDSICGTWEHLADAIHPGGKDDLKGKGYPEVGVLKSEWAEKIAPFMDVDKNNSPSFRHFRNKLRELARP